jgi:hypothetical protein
MRKKLPCFIGISEISAPGRQNFIKRCPRIDN